MVKLTINGDKSSCREFQNMAQALAYAYANGQYYAANKIEFITTGVEEKKEEPIIVLPSPDNTVKPVKKLEEMTDVELINHARSLGITKTCKNREGYIAAILEKEADEVETGVIDPDQVIIFTEIDLNEMDEEQLIDTYFGVTGKEPGPGVNAEFMIQAILRVQAEGDKLDNQN